MQGGDQSRFRSFLYQALGYFGIGTSITSIIFWLDKRITLLIMIIGFISGALINLSALILKLRDDPEAKKQFYDLFYKHAGGVE